MSSDTVRQIFPTFTDKFGRKIALYAIWLICALVSAVQIQHHHATCYDR
jgi:H+/gluconate symporter-like permease